MIRTWQPLFAMIAVLWPVIRYFGAERPFLVPRYPIAPSVPGWIDWALDLPLLVAMIAMGFSVAPRRLLVLVLAIAAAHTALTTALAWLGLPYFSAEGLGDPRLLLVGLTFGCIYLGAPALVGLLARRTGVADHFTPTKS